MSTWWPVVTSIQGAASGHVAPPPRNCGSNMARGFERPG